MKIVQLSIFVENREGRLAEIMSILAAEKIDIRALSLADTKDFGVLRMIVDTPDKAIAALKSKNIMIKTTDIIAVEVEDQPGGLSRVLNVFKAAKINIEYMYAFVEKNNSNAVMVFRVENPEKAVKKIKGIKILAAEDVCK